MKKLLIAVSVASLLLLLTAQVAPATAARDLKDVTGYSLLDDKFAVKIDMNQGWAQIMANGTDESRIQTTADLLNSSNPKVVSDGYEDDQEFYMAYANRDGIQAAYNALLKFEHNVTAPEVLNAFPEFWYKQVEDLFPGAANLILTLADNSAYDVGYINATAPFQTLVEHWRTLPDDQKKQAEMFVTNHYVSLMAYQTSAEDPFLDSQDTLFLGYTFAFNCLTDAINEFIRNETNETGDFIDDYNAVPFFNEITNGYSFGVEYENLLVVWQEIDLKEFKDCGAIIYGRNIEAITLLDSLKFTYNFTTRELGPSTVDPSITEVWADITTTYDFGETSLLITTEPDWPTDFTPTDESFLLPAPSYTFNLPGALVNIIKDGEGIPGFNGYSDFNELITVELGTSLAFYLNDDAKLRIAWDEEGYGMIMTTMTNIRAVGLATPPTHAAADAATDGLVNDTIDILANDEEVFRTTFTNKLEYELSGTVPDVDGRYEVRVKYWEKAHATHLGWFYFDLEMGLAWVFLKLLANEMGLTGSSHIVFPCHSAYFTLTEYWRWNGGAITHDPTYTAISGKAGESTETDTASSDGAFTPGFEFLVVALAIIPLAAYKKRR